jgi:hypothetical protein
MNARAQPLNPEAAVDELWRNAPAHAKAKAERCYLEEYRKTKKALLMKAAEQSGKKSAAAQEVEAYAHPEYIALLEGIKVAVEAEELARWKMVACQAAIEVWRSMEASARNTDRATR